MLDLDDQSTLDCLRVFERLGNALDRRRRNLHLGQLREPQIRGLQREAIAQNRQQIVPVLDPSRVRGKARISSQTAVFAKQRHKPSPEHIVSHPLEQMSVHPLQ